MPEKDGTKSIGNWIINYDRYENVILILNVFLFAVFINEEGNKIPDKMLDKVTDFLGQNNKLRVSLNIQKAMGERDEAESFLKNRETDLINST